MKDFSFELDIIRSKSLIKKGDQVIVGYATTYDVKSDNLQITREALDDAKDFYLKYSTVLFNHDSNRPIGRIVESAVDDVGLLIKMVLSKEEDEIWAKVQDGTINKFSIQGRIIASRPVEGQEGITQITKIELFEAGLVSVPGDPDAITISSWIARALNNSSVSKDKQMNELLEKLKEIKNRIDDDDKQELGLIIEEFESRFDVISKLRILAGKVEGDEREALELAISLIKKQDKKPKADEDAFKSESMEKETEYTLTDESDERPIFQLSSNDDAIEKEDETNTFRKTLLKKGKWYHWASDNGVLNVTEETIDNIIKNFKKKVIENVFVPLTHTDDPSKNTGDVIKLEKTEEGLDAVIEVKDESIAEKINKGLIKGISACVDLNYRVKKTNKFAGPTLLHAALVTEPYIKGLGNFTALSELEEFKDRTLILLEDEQPNFYSVLKMIKETLNTIKDKAVTEDKMLELFANIKEGIDIVKEDKHKVGESCKTGDGKPGKYVDDDGKLVCEPMTKEQLDEENNMINEKKNKKEEYDSCLETEIKGGKKMSEAVAICKTKYNLEDTSLEDESEEKSDSESEETSKDTKETVDLSDVEKSYEELLGQGKIVPAQKDSFMKLFASLKTVDLGDSKVGLAKMLADFMKVQPKIVSFDEKGTQEQTDSQETTEDDVPTDVRTMYQKMGLSDDQIKESWKVAKELKKEEDTDKESTIFE